MAEILHIHPDGCAPVRVRRADVERVVAVPARSLFGPATHVTVNTGMTSRTFRFPFADDASARAHADQLGSLIR